MNKYLNLQTVIILCATMGLAPFFPEPHVWGKLKWVAGGAIGMQPVDWFDLVMHGTPWILLIVVIFNKMRSKTSS